MIEMMVVLAIVGVLIGAILKGEQLIDSARVKGLEFSFRNVPMYVMTYQDMYRAFPGDDAAAAMKFAGATGGNGSGVIDGNWNDLTGEPIQFWQDLRLAKLMPGDLADALPTNSQGGRIGVTSAAKSPIVGMKGAYVICSDGILGKFAKRMDVSMDNGLTESGSMQVTEAGTTSNGAPLPVGAIDDSKTYLVCMGY